MGMKPLGQYQFTLNTATAKSIAELISPATIPVGSWFAVVSVTTQAARFRDDGTDPTAAIGIPIAAGEKITVYSGQTKSFKIIEAVSGAIVNIALYR